MLIPIHIENDDGMPERQTLPWLVYGLIVICTVIHAVLFVYVSDTTRVDIFYRFGASRFRFQWWTPLTCTLLHGGWLHLIGNMFFLWIYGRPLERGMGSAGFAILYVSGAFVSVGMHLLTISPLLVDEPAIGASGAISALLGAFLVLWPTARLRCLVFIPIAFRPLMTNAPAFVVLGLWFVGQLIYTLKLVGDVGGVAFWAHVAGFAWGAAAAYLAQMRWRTSEATREKEARQPLLDAWCAWQKGHTTRLIEKAAEIPGAQIEETAGTCHRLQALAALAADDVEKAGKELVAAFSQARDYRHETALLSHYLQLLKTFNPDTFDWELHRDAGFAAAALHQDNLALYAFDRALEGGCTQGLDAILRAVRAARRRLGWEADDGEAT